jgi:hypothetical protein
MYRCRRSWKRVDVDMQAKPRATLASPPSCFHVLSSGYDPWQSAQMFPPAALYGRCADARVSDDNTESQPSGRRARRSDALWPAAPTSIFRWCLSNVVDTVKRGNPYQTKSRPDQKIDAAVAEDRRRQSEAPLPGSADALGRTVASSRGYAQFILGDRCGLSLRP